VILMSNHPSGDPTIASWPAPTPLAFICLLVIVIFRQNVVHAGKHDQVSGGTANLPVAGACDFGGLLAGVSV